MNDNISNLFDGNILSSTNTGSKNALLKKKTNCACATIPEINIHTIITNPNFEKCICVPVNVCICKSMCM